MVIGVAVTIGVNGKLDGLHHGDAGAAGGNRGADLQRVEARAGGHAQFAADDIGDVGTVAAAGTVIERVRVRFLGRVGPIGADEVVAADNLVGREAARLDDRRVIGVEVGRIAGTTERDVGVVDTAIDDGHDDPGAVIAHVVELRRADVLDRLGQVKFIVAYKADGRDIGVSRQRGQRRGVDVEHDRVEHDLERAKYAGVGIQGTGGADDGALLHLGRLLGQALGRRPVSLGRGRLGQADDDPLAAGHAAQGGFQPPGGDGVSVGRGRRVKLQAVDARGQRTSRVIAVAADGGSAILGQGDGRGEGQYPQQDHQPHCTF